MSLQSLTNLRLNKMVPQAVWVIVGDVPSWIEDTEDTILIRPIAKPKHMDFRPLVGLHVDIFEIGDHFRLTEDARTAIEASKPKSLGFACALGVAGLNERHERGLSKALELMCN